MDAFLGIFVVLCRYRYCDGPVPPLRSVTTCLQNQTDKPGKLEVLPSVGL